MKSCKNKPAFFLFLILSLVCMWLIFMFSYQGGEESEGTSFSFYGLFLRLTGFDFVSHDAFRKLAHFSEFAALGFCFSGTAYFYKSETKLFASWLLASFYAVSDEIHQYFVPERACRVFDVFVDSCGAFAGVMFFAFLVIIFKKIKTDISQ